jgi:hypothetical protein
MDTEVVEEFLAFCGSQRLTLSGSPHRPDEAIQYVFRLVFGFNNAIAIYIMLVYK